MKRKPRNYLKILKIRKKITTILNIIVKKMSNEMIFSKIRKDFTTIRVKDTAEGSGVCVCVCS